MRYFPFAICLFLLLAGCARVVIEPAGEGTVSKGVSYTLRETNIQANITYTVIEKTTYEVTSKANYGVKKVKLRPDGSPVIVSAFGDVVSPKADGSYAVPDDKQFVLVHKAGPVYSIVVRDPIELLPVPTSARHLRFHLDPKAWEDFAVAVNEAKIELTDDGDMDSVNIEFQDKTGDILSGFVKTGISIAKMVAVAGVEVVEEVELGKVKVSRFMRIGDLATSRSADGKGFVMEYTDAPTPNEFGPVLSATKFSAASRDSVKIVLNSDRNLTELSNMSAKDLAKTAPFEDGKLTGVLFRVPAPVLMTVKVQDAPVYVGYKTFAQAGGFAWIPMESKPFTSRKFTLDLSPTTSGIKSYGFTGTSAGAGLANALDTTSSSATSSIKDLNTLSTEQEIKRLKTERELLEAKRLLLEEEKKQK